MLRRGKSIGSSVNDMDESLLQLIKISNTVGKDAALIQGGGGNTSVKTEDGEQMYIKASGTSLKDMSAESGWRRLRLGAVVSIIKDESIVKLDTYAREAEVVNRLLGAVISRCSSKLKQLKAEEAKPVSREVIERAKDCIGRAVFEGTGEEVAISYFYSEAIAGFCRQADASEMLEPAALTPDELLYANGPAMWIAECDTKQIGGRLAAQLAQGRRACVAFLVKGVWLFVAARGKMAVTVKEIVESSFFIRSNAFRMGGILSLNGQEQDFIYNWEPDVFRKKLANG